MSVETKPYVPKDYWDKRYEKLGIDRSGHMDLPPAYNAWLYKRKKAVVWHLLRREGLSLTDKKVLEMGAGTGVYIAEWVKAGAKVTGLDLSAKAAEALQQRYPDHTFFQADLTDASWAEKISPPYDMVTGIDVLYHLIDDEAWKQALRLASQALKPGGHFVIIEQFRHGEAWERGYIKWRSLAAYTEALEAAGFEILHRKPAFYTMVQVCDVEPPRLSAFLDKAWESTYPWMRRMPKVMGPLMYAIDTIMGGWVSEGPSMEVMLCRKKG